MPEFAVTIRDHKSCLVTAFIFLLYNKYIQLPYSSENPLNARLKISPNIVIAKKKANSSLNFKKVVKSAEKAKESFVFDYKAEEKIIFQNRQI